MYKELAETAKKIVELANTRSQNMKEGVLSLSDIDDSDEPYSDQITKILMDLSLDEVMSLQTIMYLGRDKDHNSELAPDEIFLDYKKYIESLGIKTKELEVEQMVEKGPLGEYISEGCKILGIAL